MPAKGVKKAMEKTSLQQDNGLMHDFANSQRKSSEAFEGGASANDTLKSPSTLQNTVV
jgi:hypothetical protein